MSLPKWSCFGIIEDRRIRMALYLGIDGGGTGCRAAVAEGSGRILGRGQSGPANIASDVKGACDNILAAARQALRAATGAETALPDLWAGLGLAGANSAGAVERLRAALPFARLRVETDAIAATKGALGDRDGIVAAIGTGSVFAAQRGGAIRQIGGWGLILGDEGSGARLGRSLLAEAMAAADGMRPMTPLLRAVLGDHGGPAGVIAFSLAARPAEFAQLAPRLLASGDPAAQAVLAAAAEDVATFVAALQTDPPLPVTFVGGLGAAYAGRLAGRWPIAPARGTALDGALLLAREAA
jgi:glucosamine kinase